MGGKRKEEEEQFRSRKRKLKEVERKIKKQHIYSVSCRSSCWSCSASFLCSFLFPTKCIRLFCCVFAIYTFIIKKNTHTTPTLTGTRPHTSSKQEEKEEKGEVRGEGLRPVLVVVPGRNICIHHLVHASF